MVITAGQAEATAGPMTGVACLDWLRPAVEVAAASTRLAGAACSARGARVATRTPGISPGSVKVARDFAGLTLQRWGMANLGNDVGVVISELLTNALRHALPGCAGRCGAWPIRVGLLYNDPCVLCAVADPSDQIPVLKQPNYLAETGRGLHVIASLSDRWGWTAPGRAGKVVWATFAAPAAVYRGVT